MDRKLIIPSFSEHIENYIDSEINLLSELKKNLQQLKKNSLPNNTELNAIIFELGLNIREYTRQKEENWHNFYLQADFSQHPQLWSDTTRCFSTHIVVEKEEKNLYDEINTCLNIKANNIRIRSLINDTKKKHEQNRIKYKLQFLIRAKNFKAKKLKNRFLDLDLAPKMQKKLIKAINHIISLSVYELQTRGDCVDWHKRVSDLEKKIADVCKKYDIDEKQKLKILNEATDISILTKRFLDHYYENPPTLSTSDKVRKAVKIFSLVTGVLCSVTGLTLMFTPAAPLAPIFGFVGIIGLYPLFDTFGEILKNICFYHRAPTKNQIIETALGITIVLILSAVLPVTMVAVPAIGSISGTVGAKVCSVIGKICNSINVFGMKGLGILTNSGKLLSEAWGIIQFSFNYLNKKLTEAPPFSVTKINFSKNTNMGQEQAGKNKKQSTTNKDKAMQPSLRQETNKIDSSTQPLIQQLFKQESSPVSSIVLAIPTTQNNIKRNETFKPKETNSLLSTTDPILFYTSENLSQSPPIKSITPKNETLPLPLCVTHPKDCEDITTAISAKKIIQKRKKSVSWHPSLFTNENGHSNNESDIQVKKIEGGLQRVCESPEKQDKNFESLKQENTVPKYQAKEVPSLSGGAI